MFVEYDELRQLITERFDIYDLIQILDFEVEDLIELIDLNDPVFKTRIIDALESA